MSECSKTGGGPSPNPPTGDKDIKNIDTNSSFLIELDGDTIEIETNLDFLDPTETPWNQLSTADGQGHGDQDVQHDLDHSLSESGHELNKSQVSPQLSSSVATAAPRCSGSTGPFRFPGSSATWQMPRPQFVARKSAPSPTVSHAGSSSLLTPERRRSADKVVIISEDGSSQIVDVQENAHSGKSFKKHEKEELDPAKKYWTEMLAMQTTNMKLQKNLIQEKINTELLKQELMKKKLDVESDSDNETEAD